MARDEELRLRITAEDDASKVIDKVAGKVDKLEGDDVEVTLTAQDRAEAVIRDVENRLKGLSAQDQAIVLRASSGEFSKAIKAAQRDLKNLRDLSDDDVALRVRVIEENRGALTRIDAQLDALDKRVVTPEVRVTQTGRGVAGLSGLSNALQSIPGEAGAAASALGSAVTPMQAVGAAALIATTALSKMASEFGDTALEVDTFARNTGLSLDEASRFAAVADDLGIGIEGIGTAINKMQKNVGGGLLDSLGLEALRGADTKTTFLNIIGYLQSIDDEAQQAALGAQIFGKGFSSVSELALTDVKELSAALDAVEPGQIYDDDAVAKGKALRASADELADRWEVISRQAGEAFLPALVKAEEVMSNLIGIGQELASTLGSIKIEVPGLPDSFGLTDLAGDLIPGLSAAKELGVVFGDNVSNVERFQGAVRGIAPIIDDIPVIGNLFGDDTAKGIQEVTARTEDLADAFMGQSESGGVVAESMAAAAKATAEKAKADEDAKKAAEQHAEAEAAIRDAMEEVNSLIAERSGAVLGEAEARVKLTKAQTDYNETVEDETKSTDERTVAAISSAEAYADVLEAQAKANGQSFTTTQRNDAIKASLQSLADQATGPTKKAIEAVITSLDKVPPGVNTNLTANNADALAKINAVIRQLNIAQQEFAIMNALANKQAIYVPGVPGQRSVAPPAATPYGQTVIVNMPAGSNGSDVIAAQRRHARRNGHAY